MRHTWLTSSTVMLLSTSSTASHCNCTTHTGQGGRRKRVSQAYKGV